jgi:pimeloyl-ACP methyl ester carboxylesterase
MRGDKDMAKGTDRSRAADVEPRVRRGYFESRYGQLHVHNAIPPGGGFDEATGLLCVHHSPFSGRVFHKLFRLLGKDRSVYAPDLPGFGESDAPLTRPSIVDYASAIGDFCDTMRFRQIDLLGVHGGSYVASELAIARPNLVRRVVCVGVPLIGEAEREAFRRAPWPVPVAEDGSHLMVEWRRTLQHRGNGEPLESLARAFAEKLHNGPQAWWGLAAAVEYPARDRFPRITQPTLILHLKDEWGAATLRARELLPKARLVELPEIGHGALETAPAAIANAVRDFLKR